MVAGAGKRAKLKNLTKSTAKRSDAKSDKASKRKRIGAPSQPQRKGVTKQAAGNNGIRRSKVIATPPLKVLQLRLFLDTMCARNTRNRQSRKSNT